MGAGCTNSIRNMSAPIKIKLHDTEMVNNSNELISRFEYEEYFTHSELELFEEYRKSPVEFKKDNQNAQKETYWMKWKIILFNYKSYRFDYFDKMKNQLNTGDSISIEKDLKRTFHNNDFFSNDEGISKLKNVLIALANDNPIIGYCQGMNFLIGLMLIASNGKENEVFYVFKFLCESPKFCIYGLYERNFPLVMILNFIFEKEIKRKFPILSHKLSQDGIPIEMWASKWFRTLFAYGFPFSVVYRFWNYIFRRNIFSVITISLGIIKHFYREILNLKIEEFSQFFNSHSIPNQNNQHILNDQNVLIILKIASHQKILVKRYLKKLDIESNGDNQICKIFLNNYSKEKLSKF